MTSVPPPYRVKNIGKQFAVTDAEGCRVSPFFHSYEFAEAARKAKLACAENNLRKCLTCGVNFLSEGPHNRMCSPCRNKASNAVSTYSVALEGGLIT
jgi:hypothetical protein